MKTSTQSLYIHIPFCEQKCFYCSFAVSVGQRQRVDEYFNCLAKEAGNYRGQSVETIYVGGGTPSFLETSQLERLFQIIKDNFKYPVENTECTLEANPESIDLTKAKLLRKLGVNRISLGVQSLNDKYLKYLGRNHNAQKAREAYAILRDAGFDNINVDLMYSFPGQTAKDLARDVEELISLGSDHLSLYTLTIEENSRFFTNNVKLEHDEVLASQYLLVVDLLGQAGFNQYEVSNFAKPGKVSKHNINYWQGGNYIGLGMSAHSHQNGRRWWNVPGLMDYIHKIQAGVPPKDKEEALALPERLMEMVLFGLRMNEGIDIGTIQERCGAQMDEHSKRTIKNFIKEKFLVQQGERLKITPKGRLVLDELCARLI